MTEDKLEERIFPKGGDDLYEAVMGTLHTNLNLTLEQLYTVLAKRYPFDTMTELLYNITERKGYTCPRDKHWHLPNASQQKEAQDLLGRIAKEFRASYLK